MSHDSQYAKDTSVPPVDISGLDHLVLTVADLDETAGFYA